MTETNRDRQEREIQRAKAARAQKRIQELETERDALKAEVAELREMIEDGSEAPDPAL